MQKHTLAARWAVCGIVIIVLLGCGSGGGGGGGETPPATGTLPPPPPTTTTTLPPGSISGALTVPGASTKPTKTKPSSPQDIRADFISGEIVVRLKEGVVEEEVLLKMLRDYQDVLLINMGQIYPEGPYLLRTNAYQNDAISQEEARQQTEKVITRLNAEPSIKYAEPNYISHAKIIPNDFAFAYNLQWNLKLIGLPAAWEMTTGNSSVIVAVLDTGVRFDHPDLAANLLTTGFDFVSDVDSAGDGEGIDADPTDPLTDWPVFHGTHVAGTIAAISNNGSGVAGVAWSVKIMPVRVLDVLGRGSTADIINGLRYAAGLSNVSGKMPAQPARVINMSLGGDGLCSQVYQDTLTEVRNAGVAVVVAAGNDAQESNPVVSPASCQGVIAVGAVTRFAGWAPYSSVQPYVFIAAPGGDTIDDPSLFLGGVLSTFSRSGTGQSLYQFSEGTSMAAPHVSGVIALMLSVNPNLTPSQVENILSSTANDLGSSGKDSYFGYGLISAVRAVAQAKGVTPPAVPVPYVLKPIVLFSDPVITSSLDNIVLNTGGGILTLSSVSGSVDTPTGGTWLSAALFNNIFTCGLAAINCIVKVTATRTGLTNGLYRGTVTVISNGGPFSFIVGLGVGAPPPTPAGTVAVRLHGVDSASKQLVVKQTTTTDASKNFSFTFSSVPVGQYLIDAGTDNDGSGFFGDAPDEVYGIYKVIGSRVVPVSVTAGQTTAASIFL